jgi:hypothetical protein
LLYDRLAGEYPLGVVPIRADDSCLWGSIDVDLYDVSLTDIIRRAARLPLVPCRSKSGGLHLFLFLVKPAPAAMVAAALRAAADQLGLSSATEIFPKQTHIDAERGDAGNWMVMPYFGGTFDGRLREQAGLKSTGKDMTLVEFLAAAEAARTAIDKMPTKRRKAGSDMPPCLEQIAESGIADGRRRALFHFGVYAKLKHGDEWRPAVDAFNQSAMRPPLAADEVVETIQSLGKKAYEYTCKVEPMCSLCDRAACAGRRFWHQRGIAAEARSGQGAGHRTEAVRGLGCRRRHGEGHVARAEQLPAVQPSRHRAAAAIVPSGPRGRVEPDR